MKSELPRLENGDIDFSKVDVHSDFRLFPQMFSNTADIEKFINDHKVDAPVMRRVLKFNRENKLGLTPTESEFYFNVFFRYIYDVFRIPVEYTYKETKKWLSDYLEYRLIQSGITAIKRMAFEDVRRNWEMKLLMEEMSPRHRPKEINCFSDVGEDREFYNKVGEGWVESFWIKTDLNSIQPIVKDKEAYARVHVYKDRVYIFGCDDSSYTLETKDEKESKEFARYLKCASPVWSFSFTEYIHPNLKFTN